MKFNHLFAFAALVATALFTASCSDKDEYEGPGQWDANEGYANVYFPITSMTESIDPADPTEYTFEVYRRPEHKYTWGKTAEGEDTLLNDEIVSALPAVTVKPTIKENTDDVFTVSDAVFAEGDTVSTFTASFPNAGVGSPYKLVVTLEGAENVSSYSKNTAFTYTVTRVKWNPLGKGVFRDNFWFEDSWPVEILQRDDDKSYYRIVDPFGALAEDFGLDGTQSEYLELHVMKKGDMINGITLTDAGIVDWYRLCTGYLHSSYGAVVYALHPKNFTSESLNTYDLYSNSKVNEYLEDGKTPGQIQLAPYWYMFGVGGWNYTDEPTIFINFPGYVEEYTATLDDFAWEPMFTGEYTSTQLGTKKDGVTIYQGVPVDSIENANPGCYERYLEENGTPYIIEAPYTSGNNLLFQVKKGTVSTPEGYELQETGLTALNNKVFAQILSSSKFSENEINLDITFQNKNGDVVYGTYTETLANITWSQVGTGTYVYNFWWDGGQDEEGNYLPLVDPGYQIMKRDDTDDQYKIVDWGGGVDFNFTWNSKTNAVSVPENYIGDAHPSYGEVFCSDAASYGNSNIPPADYPCSYDAASSTFTFNLVYYVSAGYFGIGEEYLQVAWDNAAKGKAKVKNRKHAVSKKAGDLKRMKLVKSTTSPKKAKRHVGKKANINVKRGIKISSKPKPIPFDL